MEVTNYSGVRHRYRDPSDKVEYSWAPGETKIVPDGVGRLVTQAHPVRFSPPVGEKELEPVQETQYETSESIPERTTEMEPSTRARRPRRST